MFTLEAKKVKSEIHLKGPYIAAVASLGLSILLVLMPLIEHQQEQHIQSIPLHNCRV